MMALSVRASQRIASRCRRRSVALVGSFAPSVTLLQSAAPKAFPSTAAPGRRLSSSSSSSSSPSVNMPHLEGSSSPRRPFKFTLERRPVRIMSRYEFSQAPLEEKEEWLQARLSSSDPHEVAAQVTRQDFLLILHDLADLAKTMPGCAIKAERWLGRLEHLAESVVVADDTDDDDSTAETSSYSTPNNSNAEFQRLVPDAVCYRLVIQTWADSTKEDPNLIVTRARRWLMKHIDSPIGSQRPDTASFNAFLDAVSKGRALKGSRSHSTIVSHAEMAQETLQMMVDDRRVLGPESRIAPDTDSFNYVIRAWTRCRRSEDVAERTIEALRFMENYGREYDSSVRLNTKSYGMVLDSLSCRTAQKVRHCKDPTNMASNGMQELETMEGVIQLMHERGGDMAPTTSIYNILVTAWAHMSQIHPHKGPPAAERVMQQMTRFADQGHDELRPDARSYLLVMRAWKNTRLPNRAQRAAWWLCTQWHDYELDGRSERRPTTETYNMVIRMFSETGEPEEAEAYFKAMEDDPSGTIRRNSESFVYLIKAWRAVAEQERNIQKLQKAADWLDYSARLEEEDESSDVRSSNEAYCSILTAARKCAPKSPSESLKLALDVFGKLQRSHHSIGPLEYNRLMQVALISLSRPEKDQMRTKFIKSLVTDCVDAGLISGALVRTIAKGPSYYDGWTLEESARMTRELFGWPFPNSWTKNVRDNGYLPRASDLIRNTAYRTCSHGEDPYHATPK